jgi:hypothetical protein
VFGVWELGLGYILFSALSARFGFRAHLKNRMGDSRKKSSNGIPPRPIRKAAFGAKKVGTLPFPSARDPPFYAAKLYSGRKVLFDFITQKTISFAICALK